MDTRASRYVNVAHIAYHLTQAALPRYSHPKRPRDTRRDGRDRGRRKAWVILAAAGFDGHAVRADALVPPVWRGGYLAHPERSARADLVAHARLDGLFGQRWQRETMPAVITRTVGDTRRSRTPSLQRREPIIKGLVYTIHRYLRLDVSESLQQSNCGTLLITNGARFQSEHSAMLILSGSASGWLR